eukprot:jgi/Hompol1/3523/HPOL_003269-RA
MRQAAPTAQESPEVAAGGQTQAVADALPYHFVSLATDQVKRSNRKYVLKLRQQPKHSRMCGFGEKDAAPSAPPAPSTPPNPDPKSAWFGFSGRHAAVSHQPSAIGHRPPAV